MVLQLLIALDYLSKFLALIPENNCVLLWHQLYHFAISNVPPMEFIILDCFTIMIYICLLSSPACEIYLDYSYGRLILDNHLLCHTFPPFAMLFNAHALFALIIGSQRN